MHAMYCLFGYILVIALLSIKQVYAFDEPSDESRLIDHLMQKYDKLGRVSRPVFNNSDTLNINFGIALIQLLDFDEANQVITTNVWERYQWNDQILTWKPEEFGGISFTRLPSDKIWTPDIVLFNRAFPTTRNPAMAVVSSDGSVLWIPPTIFKSTCSMDLFHYPRDTQRCVLKFGSWTYDGFQLDVNLYDNKEEIDMNDYIQSNEWRVLKHDAVKNVKYYPCCEEPYPDLTFSLTIQRISGGYEYKVALPVVSLMLLISFFLPPKSTCKLYLAMFVFLVYLGLLLKIVYQFPSIINSLPLIMYFPAIGMVLCLISMVFSVITINMAGKGRYGLKLPQCCRKVVFVFARYTCCICYNDEEKGNPDESNEKEWEIFGMILDRIFFVVLFVLVVIVLVMFSA